MDLSTNSGIQSSYIIEIQPLNESREMEKKSGFEVDIWNWCLTNQFPISTIEKLDSENVILKIGSPHQGYTIQTKMRDGKLDGEATLKTANNTIIAEFEYQSNEMKGECKLYYDSGELFFEGNLEDGYRQGLGKEYDKNGNVIFEGYFEKGCRGKYYKRMNEMEGYWKEVDKNGNVISICKKNENGMNEGLCYFFESGSLDRVSICENNEEVSFLYRFKNGKMIEYKDDVKCFEGYYEGSIEKGFSRTYGKEYDDEGKKVIYEGEFVDGQRYGLGVLYNDNNEIIYNGEWVKGLRKNAYDCRYILLPLLLWFCVYTVTFFIRIKLYVLLILNAFYYYCLVSIWVNYCRRMSHLLGVTRDCRPHITKRLYTYDDGFVKFKGNVGKDVKTFKIDGLNQLKMIKIGNNSFTQKKNSDGNDKSKSFHIVNCESLESIQIGRYSFIDFGGKLELKNLPKLQSIQIGTIGSDSYNFFWSSFVIRGIELILNISLIRSSKSSIHCDR